MLTLRRGLHRQRDKFRTAKLLTRPQSGAWVRKVAPARLPIPVLGPSGTGKELVARALTGRRLGRDGR